MEYKEMLFIGLFLVLPSGRAGSRFQEAVHFLTLLYSVSTLFLGRFFHCVGTDTPTSSPKAYIPKPQWEQCFWVACLK